MKIYFNLIDVKLKNVLFHSNTNQTRTTHVLAQTKHLVGAHHLKSIQDNI